MNNHSSVDRLNATSGREPGADTAMQTGSDLGSTYEYGKARASDAVETAKAKASGVADRVSGMASDAASAVKDTIGQHKDAGADAIASLARSARERADEMESSTPSLAGAVKTAADKIEAVAHDVKATSLDDMVETFSDFGRRRPMALLGCGVVAGVVLARMLAAPRA